MEQEPPFSMSPGAVWTVSDGHAGNVRQAQALARALSGEGFVDQRLDTRAPWRWFAPRQWPGSDAAFGPRFQHALLSPPGLAIGCGRQAALATRRLRARGARVVQILDPRLPSRHWDWVVAPAHDGLRGANVITVQGSLHDVDDAWLASARTQFAEWGALPRPRTAVLIGGPSAHYQFDEAAFLRLADQIEAAADDGSLLVTTSRRTPAAVRAAARARLGGRAAHLWMDETDGPNPYAGMLAWADRIVCTPDSVNMLSEACATHAPVFVFEPASLTGRPQRFLASLLASGRVRPLQTDLTNFAVQPLRETARVAALLRTRLGI